VQDNPKETTASLNENPGIFEASLSFLIFVFFRKEKRIVGPPFPKTG